MALVLVAMQFSMARDRDRAGCFRAFLANQWVGLVVFVGIAAHYALGCIAHGPRPGAARPGAARGV